ANGKLDVRSLPAPDFPAAASGTRPGTPQQALVCALFEAVLKLPRGSVGTDVNFFDLGGDSLLATRMLARLRHETGTEIPITALFETPTPAALAQRVAAGADGAPPRPVLGGLVRPQRV
ncbi:phosphopantetheine-binding protein, partial [Streptomyces sp. 13-12-16]|uniref:phosphopantetheine-binding protein n=1 Tax=Streptomyces sp. 13-12-16 TaxID=1570823 RepID=UPI0015C426D3